MKERPILFSGPMVRAILDGRKTQTRRVVVRRNSLVDGGPCSKRVWDGLDWDDAFVDPGPSPVGNDGPYLRVARPETETWHRVYSRIWLGDRLWVREAWNGSQGEGVAYRATDPDMDGAPWSPSIFMPRWASRITLEVVSVRAERVHDISEADAVAEGVETVEEFAALWEAINAARGYGWDANPWVWVVEFRRVGATHVDEPEPQPPVEDDLPF